ncbi:alpha/beta fold hydrolase [Erythrobacter crassostreae]|uniref:Proline iminopeptidase n=1 Tax=Erythrobacter crassostreae TaxID=2828328 RepID=A0A9X1JKH7_9SPHN|nr:alpha/beta fold hydrolase [Erythrobacter crassostrea]MBV7259060.1 alpha/beta fold hydrolase [Erythrobacter crassostrea]
MPRSTILTSLALAMAIPVFAPAMAHTAPNEEAITFETRTGETVEAYSGFLTVPMNRSDPDSGTTKVAYVRFPATTETPGNPIVYLSGGPGGSGIGTAKGPRFPLFMAMRQHGDVIALDQRGTGQSDKPAPCVSSVEIGEMERISDAEHAERYKLATRECAAQWKENGVDLRGFTTAESAQDLSDLRQHLGAGQISLWSISYGSHLALAALSAIPDELDRVIMAATEGLDQTVKLPSRTLGYFGRLQAAVDAQPEAARLYPNILGLIERVHAKLDANPMTVIVPTKDGGSYDLLLQKRHLQQFSGGLISDPQYAAVLLMMYRQLDEGDPTMITFILQRFWSPDEPITFSAMSLAMDRASGITPARLKAFEQQASSSPVGKYMNFPMPQILDELKEVDIGPAFRDGPFGDTPVLMLTGTLDGRTYPEGHIEATAGLSKVEHITVENAGHNLFMTSSEVQDAMHTFMRGEAVKSDRITVEAPDFSKLPDLGG